MSRLNFPQQQQPDIAPDQLAVMVSDMAELQALPPVQTEDELEERLEYFFQWCSRKQLRPTVSLMCLCVGYTRQALWKWQQKGGRKGELIDRAKQLLEALTEEWLLTGKTNPVSGIFILKSQFGFKDVVTLETPAASAPTANMTPAEILEQIEKDIPIETDYQETEGRE